MFDELRFNCLFTLNFTQLWGCLVGATNQCCITSQNSMCRLFRSVCRGVSRQFLAKGTWHPALSWVTFVCVSERSNEDQLFSPGKDACRAQEKPLSVCHMKGEECERGSSLFARRGIRTSCMWRGDRRHVSLAEVLLCLAQGAVSAG